MNQDTATSITKGNNCFCVRCGYSWKRRNIIPSACPYCKNHNYYLPRIRKIKNPTTYKPPMVGTDSDTQEPNKNIPEQPKEKTRMVFE